MLGSRMNDQATRSTGRRAARTAGRPACGHAMAAVMLSNLQYLFHENVDSFIDTSGLCEPHLGALRPFLRLCSAF